MARRPAIRTLIWILAGFALLVALGACCWRLTLHAGSQPHPYADQPRLKVDTSHRDLGSVYPGDKVELQYPLENVGGGELIISDLHTSCGCAPATIDTNPIPPGGRATISVSFQTPMTAGIVGYGLGFQTNDPNLPQVRLTFQVLARRAIEACPPNVFAGAVPRGNSVSHDLELCSTDGMAFDVKAHWSSVNWIRLERLAGSTSLRYVYRVTIDGTESLGTFSESVEFLTSCTKQEKVVVPVLGEMVSGHRSIPANLLLKSTPVGAVVDAKVVIKPQDSGYGIRSVEVQHDEWQVASWKLERDKENTFVLHLQVRVPAMPGYKRTVLVLRPSGTSAPHEIPLSCLVTSKPQAKD